MILQGCSHTDEFSKVLDRPLKRKITKGSSVGHAVAVHWCALSRLGVATVYSFGSGSYCSNDCSTHVAYTLFYIFVSILDLSPGRRLLLGTL